MKTENRATFLFIDKSGDYSYTVKAGRHVEIAFLITGSGRMHVSLTARLIGKGASCAIYGLVIPGLRADIALTTRQVHDSPGATSDLLVKSVLGGVSDFTFDGHIAIAQKAQQSDAYQRNENLLVGSGAHAVSRPVLEIMANDVRCTHGATVAQLSADELWYAMSRGIDKESATALLVGGFVDGLLAKIGDVGVREAMTDRVHIGLVRNGILGEQYRQKE